MQNKSNGKKDKKTAKQCETNHYYYNDYSLTSEDKLLTLTLKQQHRDIENFFPIKLYTMLAEIMKNQERGADFASWQIHGRSFMVHDKDEFTKYISKCFRLKKYASFSRQLLLYGFRRVRRGPDKGAFYHELFLRGKSFLCYRIQKQSNSSNNLNYVTNTYIDKKTSFCMPSSDEPPDFYSMPVLLQDNDSSEEQAPSISRRELQQHDQFNVQGTTLPCVNYSNDNDLEDGVACPAHLEATWTTSINDAALVVATTNQCGDDSVPCLEIFPRNNLLTFDNILLQDHTLEDDIPYDNIFD